MIGLSQGFRQHKPVVVSLIPVKQTLIETKLMTRTYATGESNISPCPCQQINSDNLINTFQNLYHPR